MKERMIFSFHSSLIRHKMAKRNALLPNGLFGSSTILIATQSHIYGADKAREAMYSVIPEIPCPSRASMTYTQDASSSAKTFIARLVPLIRHKRPPVASR